MPRVGDRLGPITVGAMRELGELWQRSEAPDDALVRITEHHRGAGPDEATFEAEWETGQQLQLPETAASSDGAGS